ncbi:adenosylcobinamide-GDP ribazoletransferase [Paracoccus sp. (in: a-proteobacteria)]|uniref:adenosylcobinamide-GDP ribazoletransferase n=1 Tax=Paracoccus sp. TaxID=267 RepID=UPI0032206471
MARRLAEAATALVWLTRLPAGRLIGTPAPVLAQAAWAFPLAGLAVGLLAALVLALAAVLHLPPGLAALLAVGAMIWTTGALHEDGLADLADAAGARTPERRLEIMRDSRIGSYGVLALIMVTGLRVMAVAALMARDALLAQAALVGMAMASRAGVVVALAVMRPARADGLGRAAGRPGGGALAVALCFGAAALLLPSCWLGLPGWMGLIAAVAAAQAWLARRAGRALGGQTGDVLGALQQVGEAAGHLALLVLIQAVTAQGPGFS